MNSFDGHKAPFGVTPASQSGDDTLSDSSLSVVEAAYDELDSQDISTSLDVIEDAYAQLDREESTDSPVSSILEEREFAPRRG